MNPDLMDPKLCICGDMMEEDQEFCSQVCEQDFYYVQYLSYLEAQNVAERVWYAV